MNLIIGLLFGVGLLIWELKGARKNTDKIDTVSEIVWWSQARPYVGPVLRVLVAVFTASLVGHFAFGWSLLP